MSDIDVIEQATQVRVEDLTLSVRLPKGEIREGLRPEDLLLFDRSFLKAWRPPACYKNQQNLPGFFWVSQTNQLIFYESRLEMTVLKSIDFGESIEFVLAQPFCLHFVIDGKPRFHIPDFLIWRTMGTPLLINVKPRKYLDRERNRESFAACNALSRRIKIEHRVSSEPEPVCQANLRWLAGYRPEPILLDEAGPVLMARLSGGSRLRFAAWIDGVAEDALVRAVAFHLMWTRQVEFDQDAIVGDATTVWRVA